MLEPPLYTYHAVVDKVVDADTIDLTVDLGFRVLFRIRTRLEGLDAPELSTTLGKAAKAFVVKALPPGSAVLVRTHPDPRDKFGRWLAHIQRSDGEDINALLLGNGYAKPYKGGTR